MDRTLTAIDQNQESPEYQFADYCLKVTFLQTKQTFQNYFINIDRITDDIRYLENFYRECRVSFRMSVEVDRDIEQLSGYKSIETHRVRWEPDVMQFVYVTTWYSLSDCDHNGAPIDARTADLGRPDNSETKPLLECSALIRVRCYRKMESLINRMSKIASEAESCLEIPF